MEQELTAGLNTLRLTALGVHLLHVDTVVLDHIGAVSMSMYMSVSMPVLSVGPGAYYGAPCTPIARCIGVMALQTP